ncbi:hypothetical protein Avbf_05254 [Armadillidium vulgare]|nr:hypothetical protein Avbf_05254 [Armadillidium vulgare]
MKHFKQHLTRAKSQLKVSQARAFTHIYICQNDLRLYQIMKDNLLDTLKSEVCSRQSLRRSQRNYINASPPIPVNSREGQGGLKRIIGVCSMVCAYKVNRQYD